MQLGRRCAARWSRSHESRRSRSTSIDRALSSGLSALAPDVSGDEETLAALRPRFRRARTRAPGRRRPAVCCRALFGSVRSASPAPRRAAVAAHPRLGQRAVDHDDRRRKASAQVGHVDLHRTDGADDDSHDGFDADHGAPEPRRRSRVVERLRIVGHVSGPGGHHRPGTRAPDRPTRGVRGTIARADTTSTTPSTGSGDAYGDRVHDSPGGNDHGRLQSRSSAGLTQ